MPKSLQEPVFNQPFEVAESANFSRSEQDSYQSSLKYYRDLNNVVNTSWEEGKEEGRREGELAIILRLLSPTLGEIPRDLQEEIGQLSLARLEELSEILLDFSRVGDLRNWLNK